MKEFIDTSASGQIVSPFEGVTSSFTDIQKLSESKTNIILKAKRYGKWWILKCLAKDVANDGIYQQKLRKEFDLMMSIDSPFVVKAYSMEPVDDYGMCIIMEYIEGQTLDSWTTATSSRRQRNIMFVRILNAVEDIHASAVVHRDLKPSNIIVNRAGGYPKIIDFGLADSDSHATLKQPAGTAAFIAPEQTVGYVPNTRNDIFSLGAIAKCMNLGCSRSRIIKRCLEPIDRRFQSVGDLKKALASADRIRKNFRRGIAFMFFAAVAATVVALLYRHISPTADSEQISQIQKANIALKDSFDNVITTLNDSLSSVSKANRALSEENAAIKKTADELQQKFDAEEAHRRKIADIIAAGNRRVERYRNDLNADLTQIAEDYVASIATSDISQKELGEIRNAVILKVREIYLSRRNKTENGNKK